MEKGGWLDQILLGILNVLNHPLLAVVVALGGGFAVALLVRLSPKEDWELLKEGPGACTRRRVPLAGQHQVRTAAGVAGDQLRL